MQSVGEHTHERYMTYQKGQKYKIQFTLQKYVPDGGIISILLPDGVEIDSDPFDGWLHHDGLEGLKPLRYNNPSYKYTE